MPGRKQATGSGGPQSRVRRPPVDDDDGFDALAIGAGSADREIEPATPAPGEKDLERAIAAQVRAYRQATGVSVAEMAGRVGISKAMLSKIENAQTSCSLTTLSRLAAGLDVPVTALFRGVDAEREAVFVPAGRGAQIIRRGSRHGHLYELLGPLRGPHKRMEAVVVTLTEASEVFPLFQHPGTELIYMLDGRMTYGHGEGLYPLGPGDALQFDGEGTHGPVALSRLPARFLSVTAYGEPPH